MKSTPLYSDPIAWSQQVAKSGRRVVVWTVLHVCLISAGCLLVFWRLCALGLNPMVSLSTLLMGFVPIVLMGMILPACYLNALHQLLNLLRDQHVPVDSTNEIVAAQSIGLTGQPQSPT
jgi:hypothetical protein